MARCVLHRLRCPRSRNKLPVHARPPSLVDFQGHPPVLVPLAVAPQKSDSMCKKSAKVWATQISGGAELAILGAPTTESPMAMSDAKRGAVRGLGGQCTAANGRTSIPRSPTCQRRPPLPVLTHQGKGLTAEEEEEEPVHGAPPRLRHHCVPPLRLARAGPLANADARVYSARSDSEIRGFRCQIGHPRCGNGWRSTKRVGVQVGVSHLAEPTPVSYSLSQYSGARRGRAGQRNRCL